MVSAKEPAPARWKGIVVAVLALGVQLLPGCSAEESRRPNFIVILCDNLGYGDVEPFGSRLHRTPNLNRMAREGLKLTHFYATAGVCTPSRASLLTGAYAQRVGMHVNPRDGQVLRPISPYGLHPDETTIAESLKPLGYATAVIGKWHLGDQPEFLPTRQGFDSFFGIPYSDDMTQAVGRRIGERMDGVRWPPLPLMENETVIEAPVDRNLLARRYTQRALAFMKENRNRPFFLYLPHAMPGSTRNPFASERFRGKSRNGPWGDSVEELDWSVGRILDKLVEFELDRHTLVLWTSDNGAPLSRNGDGDSAEKRRGVPGGWGQSGVGPNRGGTGKGTTGKGTVRSGAASPARGSNGPLFGRGYTTAEGGFRVPAIAWWPGRIAAGTVCRELATTMDLMPTLTRLAGGEPPRDRILDGHDIRPLLFAEPAAVSPYDAFYYYDRDQLHAVRQGPWKLFVPLDSFRRHPHFDAGRPVEPLLFNLVSDVGSTRNVATEHREIVERLMALAAQARADLGDRGRPGANQRPPGIVQDPGPRVLRN